MRRWWRVGLPVGLLMIVLALAVEGPSLWDHTLAHVVRDLTVELWVHVLLGGVALLAYAGAREALDRWR